MIFTCMRVVYLSSSHNYHKLIELPRDTTSVLCTGLIPIQIIMPIYLDVSFRLNSIFFARFGGKNLLRAPTLNKR